MVGWGGGGGEFSRSGDVEVCECGRVEWGVEDVERWWGGGDAGGKGVLCRGCGRDNDNGEEMKDSRGTVGMGKEALFCYLSW